jgi:hypothetical protein
MSDCPLGSAKTTFQRISSPTDLSYNPGLIFSVLSEYRSLRISIEVLDSKGALLMTSDNAGVVK